MHGLRRVAGVLSSLLLWQGLAAAAIEYTLTDLGSVTVGALSGDGTAVGWSQAQHAQVLAPVPQALPDGGAASRALGVAGPAIVGENLFGGPTFFQNHAALWVQAQGPVDLGTLGAENLFSQATDVNATETISGYSDLYDIGPSRPVVWVARQIDELGTLGGPSGFADAINTQGDIVGESETMAGQFHATLWPIAGGIVDLDTLGSDASLAHAVNDVGVVVGDTGARAFQWTAATGMQLLPLLPGHTRGTAQGVNDAGTIVGRSTLPGMVFGSEVDRAVRWDGGVPTDLNTLVEAPGWELQEARAINDAGQILGAGRFQGQPRAWLLTPIPQIPVCPVALVEVHEGHRNTDQWIDRVGLAADGAIWECLAGAPACTQIAGALHSLLLADLNDDAVDDLVGLWGVGVFVWLSGEHDWQLIGYLDQVVAGRWYADGKMYLAGRYQNYVYKDLGLGQWQFANGWLQSLGTADVGDHDVLLGWNGCWYYLVDENWIQGACG